MQQSAEFNFQVLSTPVLDAETTSFVHVSMRKNDVGNTFVRTPSDIVLVIDTSGSMGDMASTTTVESSFNLLDIVIHAVKTVIHTAGPQDRISIVSFSSTSEIICGLTDMTETGKTQVLAKLSTLDPNGGTNIWAGLKSGLDVLFHRSNHNNNTTPQSTAPRNAALLLLTDGQDSCATPGGHIDTLKNYCEKLGGKYPGIISTFGFGYSSDSELLKRLADEGGGMFSFIPDSGFVGTAFINSLSNIFSTFTIDARLAIEPLEGENNNTNVVVEIVSNSFIGCQLPYGTESWGVWVNIGSLQVEQQVDIVLKVTHNPTTSAAATTPASLAEGNNNVTACSLVRARLEYHPVKAAVPSTTTQSSSATTIFTSAAATTTSAASGTPTDSKIAYECVGPTSTTDVILIEANTQETYAQIFRLQAVQTLNEIMRLIKGGHHQMAQARVVLQTLITTMMSWLAIHDPVDSTLLSPPTPATAVSTTTTATTSAAVIPTDILAGVASVHQQRIAAGSMTVEALPLDRIKGLLKDLTGQVTEAISKEEYYFKWGRHYLPSLQRAHALQQSNNFKDPGIQFYGGALFKRIQNETDDIFNNLPLPPPRNHYTQIYHTSSAAATNNHTASARSCGAAAAAAPVAYSMADYNNRDAGCIHGDCVVKLFNSKEKRVRELMKGDIVECITASSSTTKATTTTSATVNDDHNKNSNYNNSNYGRVKCVVETKCNIHHPTQFISFTETGLLITPWHPIMNKLGKWQFPCECNDDDESIKKVELFCDAVYSLVIERVSNEDVTNTLATATHCIKKGTLTVTTIGAVSVTVNPKSHTDPSAATVAPINDNKEDDSTAMLLTSIHHSTIIVNGIACATLAHGITNNSNKDDSDVISHVYFGTHAVLKDLQSQCGWSIGRVVILNECSSAGDNNNWIRCDKTGLVKGMMMMHSSYNDDTQVVKNDVVEIE